MSDDPFDLPEPRTEAEIEEIVQAALAEDEEDRIPVMLLIHNGVVENGVPQFAPFRYMLPANVLMDLRGQLSSYEANWPRRSIRTLAGSM